MTAFGWTVGMYRNYCLRPFFFYEGRYYSGEMKVVHIGPLAITFRRKRKSVA